MSRRYACTLYKCLLKFIINGEKKFFLRDGQCFTKPLMIMSFEVEDNDVEESC